MEREIVKIKTDFIRLDQLLKFSGAVQTGGQAKEAVVCKTVLLNGVVCVQRGKKVFAGDVVTANGKEYLVENEGN